MVALSEQAAELRHSDAQSTATALPPLGGQFFLELAHFLRRNVAMRRNVA